MLCWLLIPNATIFMYCSIYRFLNELQRGYRPSHTQHTTSISTPRKMDTHARVGEIDGIDSSKMKNFPYSSFKLLGGLQMGIGALCLLLGVTDVLLFLYTSSHYNDDTLNSLTIACVPVWSGLWVSIFNLFLKSLLLYHADSCDK